MLSEIITHLNDSFGKDLSDEDKVNLQHVQKRLQESTELKKAMSADNSDTNKRKKFDEVLMGILLSYVNDRFEFYKKMEDPKVKEYVGGMLWRGIGRIQGSHGCCENLEIYIFCRAAKRKYGK
ncbi:MAG: hypothetical protein IPJ40_07765 [Saprospirales bacterium]|nr:hypothetical protein [Saprospirales bacterium]